MVNAQSGPAADLGLGMHSGVLGYFARINAAGGVHGRKLVLINMDDGYEPERTAEQTRLLVKTHKIFALLGYVGTPTSRAALPIAQQAQMLYLFPLTGAEFLRTPAKPKVFNIRASYIEEAERLVQHATEDLGLQRIAILMQDDSFGEAVKSGLSGALHKRGLQIDAQARIQRNSLEVDDAIETLRSTQPQAVFFVGTHRQLAAAIKQAKAVGLKTRFITVSFIGTEEFIREAGSDADGVYISQVVPSPHDRSLKLVQNYQADVDPQDISHASLEGYIGAMVFVQALRNAGKEPTRERFIDALEHTNTDLGGFKVRFSRTDHQGSEAVFLTRVENGQAVTVDKMRD
jgi:ABC-type branched-subunit amino acid transport system substrate-binding protein